MLPASQQGLLPRVLEELLGDAVFRCRASMLEVYNERIRSVMLWLGDLILFRLQPEPKAIMVMMNNVRP